MRRQQVVEAFEQAFGGAPEGLWFAPGRVNLIGEHTDYNDGFVLPLALAPGTVTAARRRDDGMLRARSLQEPEEVVTALSDITCSTPGGWGAYVAGVLWALRAEGHDVPGLDLLVDGDVPLGAGLSSSHSLECSVAVACNDLAGLSLDRTALALIVQRAENDLVGAPTGIMDQMASLHGQQGHAVLLDCRSLDIEPVPFDPCAHGLALLVIDTRTPHVLVDGQYAARRTACEQAAAALGVAALRDVTLARLDEALSHLDDEEQRRRVRHVVTENDRVLRTAQKLREGSDLREIGPDLIASHASMRQDFEITVPQVDLAVDLALSAGAHGARMTGGGFGGCIVALVEADRADAVAAVVTEAYQEKGYRPPQPMVVNPGEGAHRLS